MSKNVFLFSGQGSQYPKMGLDLAEKFSSAKKIFSLGSDIVGFDILNACENYSAEELAVTSVSQPAIMAVSLAAFAAAAESGIEFSAAAGHSLGEYAALVASEIVSCEDGFRLIKLRSEAMQKAAESSDGAMYAVIGKNIEVADKVCEKICGESDDEYVIPANYNSSAQTVIAGKSSSAAKAAEELSSMGFRVIKLNVSSAFHSRLMQNAADEFLSEIQGFKFNKPSVDFYSNLSGEKLTEEDIGSLAARLSMHIVSPVKFTKELSNMEKDGIDTYIELGPSKVLSGLVKKTLKGAAIFNIEDSAGLEKTVSALAAKTEKEN